MLRPLLAAVLGAAFGALAIGPARERVADQLWQPAEACAIGLVALAAGLIAVFVMSCREPARRYPARRDDALPPAIILGGHQPGRQPRDARGRFQ